MSKTQQWYTEEPLSMLYTFYLQDTISEKHQPMYNSWCQILRNATTADVVYVRINCEGGDISIAQQLVHAINNSDAQVISEIEGECCSAATFIFLACQKCVVNPNTTFLVHDFTTGIVGKGNEFISYGDYFKKWSSSLVQDTYKGFLTDLEIEEVVKGKTYIFTHTEVLERLKNMAKLKIEETENG